MLSNDDILLDLRAELRRAGLTRRQRSVLLADLVIVLDARIEHYTALLEAIPKRLHSDDDDDDICS